MDHHRADGEVRGDKTAEFAISAALRQIVDERLREARGADDQADAAVNAFAIGEDLVQAAFVEIDDDIGFVSSQAPAASG